MANRSNRADVRSAFAAMDLLAIILVPAGLFMLGWNLRFAVYGQAADATLVASERVSGKTVHTLEFVDPATGKFVRRRTSRSIEAARVGDAIPIFVSTDGKAQFLPQSIWTLWVVPGIVLAFGLPCLFFACLAWMAIRRGPEIAPGPPSGRLSE